MNKCGMCGFFGECTHRKETDSAEDCNQYHDDFYVNVSEFQKKVLEFVTSGELDKFFKNTVFDNYEYKNDCKSAMITGMSLASMITSDCELIGIGMEISQDKAGE